MMIEKIPPIRLFLLFFGSIGRRLEPQLSGLKANLRGARQSITYHNYYARTVVYAIAAFLAVETLLVIASLAFFRITAFSPTEQILLAAGFVLPALISSYFVYQLRLYIPSYIAQNRAREIDLTLPNVSNFLLALSRAGVSTGKSLQLLAGQSRALGTAADEFRYAWRDIEYFGADVVTALNYVAETTKLDALKDFIEGYTRALTGRGDVEVYLENMMEDFFEQARQDQEEFLNSLSVLAEIYVAIFVALPIFSIIILVVMGFTGASDILLLLRVVTYAILPLTALGFLIFVDTILQPPLGAGGRHIQLEPRDEYEESLSGVESADPARAAKTEAYLRDLRAYIQRREIVELVKAPFEGLRKDPKYAFYLGSVVFGAYIVTKVGLGVLLPQMGIFPELPRRTVSIDAIITRLIEGGYTLPAVGEQVWSGLAALDTIIVEAAIIGLAIFTVFYEARARYLRGFESQLPAFLKDLDRQQRIGMSLRDSIRNLQTKKFGRMDVELNRMVRDIRLNAQPVDALKRSANRVRSPVYTRIVILLDAASEAAERLEPVIDAMAERAELSQKLNKERRTEMSLYLIIIYIAFLVFVGILAVLQEAFFPQIPTGETVQQIGFGFGGDFDPEPYTVLFFHMSVIQAVLSGLVGGKMSEGKVAAGAKHVLVMIVIAYITFTIGLPMVEIQLS